jgi:hypothetical protein
MILTVFLIAVRTSINSHDKLQQQIIPLGQAVHYQMRNNFYTHVCVRGTKGQASFIACYVHENYTSLF